MAKRLNKNLVVALTAISFVIMTAAGIALVYLLQERNPERFVKLGDEAAAKQPPDWAAARQYYGQAYEVSQDPVYLIKVGDVCLEQGEERFAMDAWRQAVMYIPDPTKGGKLDTKELTDPKDLKDLKDLKDVYEKQLDYLLETNQGPAGWIELKTMAEKLLGLDAKSHKGLFALGRTLIELANRGQELGNEAEGVAKIEEAIAAAPDVLEYVTRLGMYHEGKGMKLTAERKDQEGAAELDKAEALYKAAVEAQKQPGLDAVKARNQYAFFLLGQRKKNAEAEALLEEAAGLAGESVEARSASLVGRARFWILQWFESRQPGANASGDPQLAEKVKQSCQQTIDIDPNSFDPYFLLVTMYRAESKFKDAIQISEDRLAIPIARTGRKQREQKVNRYSLLLQAAELYVGSVEALEAGSTERVDALGKALKNVQEAEAEIPLLPQTAETESVVRIAEGNLREATRLCEVADQRYQERKSASWMNSLRLARMRLQAGELGAARTAIETVCRNPNVAAQAGPICFTTYAEILLLLDAPAEALAMAQEAVRRKADEATVLPVLAAIYEKLGRAEDAARTYELLKAAGADVVIAKARNLMVLQKEDEAIDAVMAGLKSDPGNEQYAVLAAQMLFRRNRAPEALAVLNEAMKLKPDSETLKNLARQMDPNITPEQRSAEAIEVAKGIKDEFSRELALAGAYVGRDTVEAEKHLLAAQGLLIDKATDVAKKVSPDVLRSILSDRLKLALGNKDLKLAEDIVATAIAHNADSADGQTFLGQLRLAQERTDEAAQAFKTALDKQPTSSETLLYYGHCLMLLNRATEARITFERATEISPREGRAWKGLALIAGRAANEKAFEEYVNRCMKLMPDDPDVRGWSASLRERENPAEGITRREEIRQKNKDDVDNLINLARLYRELGRRNNDPEQDNKAEECLKQAMENPKADARVKMTAAAFYRDIGRPEPALRILQDLVKSTDDPADKAEYQLEIGSHFLQLKDVAQADANYLAAADIKLTETVCVSLGQYFFQTNRHDRAVEWLERAVTLAEQAKSPQAARIRRMEIETLITMGDAKREQAKAKYAELVKNYPDDMDGLRLLAELEASEGFIDKAIETLTRYLEKRSDDTRSLYRRAQHLGARGQWQRACTDLEKIRSTDPAAIQYRPSMLLARAYELTDRKDLAEAELKTVLEKFPDADDVAAELMGFYERQRPPETGKAEQVVTTRLAMAPKDPRWLYHAGRLAAKANDEAKAVKLLRDACDKGNYNPQYVTALLDAHIQFKSYQAGIDDYEKGLPPDKRHPLVVSKYACLQALKGETDAAVKTFCLAVDLAGADATAQLPAISTDVSKAFGADKGIDLFRPEPADQRLRRPSRFLLTAMLAGSAGQNSTLWEEAETVAESLVETSESDVDRALLLLHLAAVESQRGKWEESRRHYEESLALSPRNIMALNNLAYLLIDSMNLPEQGSKYAQEAARYSPRQETLDTLGWAYVKMGKFQEAIGELTRAVQLDEYYVPARAHLGEAYRRAGDFTSAQDTLNVALQRINATKDTEYKQAVETSLEKVGKRDSGP